MKKLFKSIAFVLALALMVAAMPRLRCQAEKWLYPCKYSVQVEAWAAEYQLDPLLIYTFIRTESGFNPQAESEMGARGLMQMTEETFDWLRGKTAAGEELTFEDLYDPSCSIRFGAYYLRLCLDRYSGDVATAAAAYHSGWGTVDTLLKWSEYSLDGEILQVFPYNQMNHYVDKIQHGYQTYTRLYGEGI